MLPSTSDKPNIELLFDHVESQLNTLKSLPYLDIRKKEKNKSDSTTLGRINLPATAAIAKSLGETEITETIGVIKEAKHNLLSNIHLIKKHIATLDKENKQDQTQILKIKDRLEQIHKLEKAVENILGKLAVNYEANNEKKQELKKCASEFEKSINSAMRDTQKGVKLSPAELPSKKQAFYNQLKVKNVGQLVGDSYLLDMKDSSGLRLEGNHFEDISDFLGAAFEYLPLEHPEEFSPELLRKFEEIISQFQAASKLDARIRSVFQQANSPNFQNQILSLSQDITKSIETLKPGESFIMPWGWASKNGIGHAMIAEFKKEASGNVLIKVFNTGAGTEEHDLSDKEGKSYVNTVKEFRLGINDIKNDMIISRMLEPRVVPGNEKIMKDGEDYDAKELYHILKPYALASNKSEQAWMKAQFSGTCALRCALAYINYKTGGDYKRFKHLLEIESVEALLANPKLRTDPEIYRMLIGRTIANLYRQELKKPQGADRSDLRELKRLEKKYFSIYKKTISQNQPVSASIPAITTKIDLALSIPKKSPLKPDKAYAPSKRSNPVNWVNNYQLSAVELDRTLGSIISYVKDESQVGKTEDKKANEIRYAKFNSLCVDSMLHLGRIFTNPTLTAEKDKLLLDLSKNKVLCEGLIDKIDELTGLIVELKLNNQAQSLALASATVAIRNLGIVLDNISGFKKDARLDSYSIPMIEIETMSSTKNPAFQLLNPHWDEDLKNLNAYFQSNFQFQTREICNIKASFDYNERGFLNLHLDSDDYKYWAAQAAIPGKDWKQIDADREKVKDRYRGTKQHYRIMNNIDGLPKQYLALFNCVNRTFQVSSFATASVGKALASNPFSIRNLRTINDGDFNLKLEYPGKIMLIESPESEIIAATKAKLDAHWDQPNEIKKLALELMTPKLQNEVMSGYARPVHEVMSIVSENTPLRFSMLIDYFKKSHNLLLKPENQLFFTSVLHAPLRLGEALKKNPGLKQEILDYFNDASQYFLQPTLPITSKERALVGAFIALQRQQFISTLRQTKDPEAETLMASTRKEVAKMCNSEIYKEPEAKILLQLALINSYAMDNNINKEDANNLITAAMMIGRLELEHTPRTIMRKDYQVMAQAVLRNHINSIGNLVKGQEVQIFNPILSEYGIDSSLYQKWTSDTFPVFVANSAKGIVEIDILTGSLKLNGKDILFNKVSASIAGHTDYKRVFGKTLLDIIVTPDYYAAKDKTSPIRIVNESTWEEQKIFLYRQLDQNWFEYKPITNFPVLKNLPFSRDLDVWISTDDKSNIKARLYNNKTNNLEYLLHTDGTITISSQNNRRFELLDQTKFQGLENFSNFAPGIMILKEVGTKNIIMMHPKNINEHGEPFIFDLSVSRTARNQKIEKWVLRSDPEYWISAEQHLKGIQNFKSFIVIENANHQKSVLVPQVSYTEIKDPKELTKHVNEIPCLRLQLKNDHVATQNNSVNNLYSAYIHLCQASTPQDYYRVLDLLESVREYRRYNKDELKLFGWLYDLSTGMSVLKPDNTPESYALRLFILSMVRDNFSKYPQLDKEKKGVQEKSNLDADVVDHESKWNEICTLKLSDKFLSPKELITSEKGSSNEENLKKIFAGYIARRNNIPQRLQLENLIPAQQLADWGYQNAVQNLINRNKVPTFADALTYSWDASYIKDCFPIKQNPNLSLEQCRKNIGLIRTRRSQDDFAYLIKLAESQDLNDRNLVRTILEQRIYDGSPNSKDKTRDAILLLTLYKNEYSPLKSSAQEIFAGFQTIEEGTRRYGETINKFNEFLDKINKKIEQDSLNTNIEKFRNNAPKFSKEKKESPTQLPTYPHPIEFKYIPQEGLFEELNNLSKTYFQTKPLPKEDLEAPFKLRHKVDKFIEDSIEHLNKDYLAGRKTNQTTRSFSTIGNPETTAVSLVNIEKKALEAKNTSEIDKLKIKKKEIEKLANEKIRKKSKLRAEIGGLKKEKVTLDDCLLLFLQKDRTAIHKATGISDPIKQDSLYQKIGEYLELSAKTVQQTKVIKEMDKVGQALQNKEKVVLEESLINLANVLNEKHLGQASVNAEAILVFENKLSIILRDYQVEGLNEMLGHPDNDLLKYSDTFQQRIQAGGKTLVWGHLLAHLKADGYHLSIHVSPTHQYASNLYDMGDRSKYVFKQNEHTMIFDDSPAYYKKEYLETTLKTLKQAIHNREYINTTKKSLDTLLAQYDRFNLNVSTGRLDYEKSQQLVSIKLMEEILALLRSRGFFTFDEVHQAFEPNHVLNIPLDSPVHPDRRQCDIISKSLRLAIEAKGPNRNPLLQLKENKQSQQTEAEKEMMKEEIAKGLCLDPVWQVLFGIRTGDAVDGTKRREIEIFLLNPDSEIPVFLKQLKEDPANINTLVSTDYILLARQLLAGNWLSLALSKGVNEFHGINRSKNALPISIPFTANMVPAYGSEFSDQFVKILNTQIAYLVEGLSFDQTIRFVQRLRQEAIAEYEDEIKANPEFTIHETKVFRTYNDFCIAEGVDKKGFSFQLFEFNENDPVAVQVLQSALNGKSSLAMELLLDFVNRDVISQVDIFNYQVSINGQNTASMSKHIN